jgi:hypothetical protein
MRNYKPVVRRRVKREDELGETEEICMMSSREVFPEELKSIVRGWMRCSIGKGIDESGLSGHSEQEWRSVSQRSLMRRKGVW